MVLERDGAGVTHARFRALPGLLRAGSLLVLNDTRVIPARLAGRKRSGGAVEALLVRPVEHKRDDGGFDEQWQVLGRGLARVAPGTALDFGPELSVEMVAHGERGQAVLRFRGRGAGLLDVADHVGATPLPPYIEAARERQGEGAADHDDRERYQTVYARVPGAVAAPTAGLHFTEELLAQIGAGGHRIVRLTLHVGPGTFRPVDADDPGQHRMDPERYEVPADTAEAVEHARREGRPVVAVGTTVVRALEAAAARGAIAAGPGETDLFIQPGARFQVVTDLITNFHLPRSTLLMLVAAFAGRERVLAAYDEAIRAGYRFYSYGDAMFVRGAERAP
jgi:S-adenosylmethionine:tRNA ribosyltransferase-isomerase